MKQIILATIVTLTMIASFKTNAGYIFSGYERFAPCSVNNYICPPETRYKVIKGHDQEFLHLSHTTGRSLEQVLTQFGNEWELASSESVVQMLNHFYSDVHTWTNQGDQSHTQAGIGSRADIYANAFHSMFGITYSAGFVASQFSYYTDLRSVSTFLFGDDTDSTSLLNLAFIADAYSTESIVWNTGQKRQREYDAIWHLGLASTMPVSYSQILNDNTAFLLTRKTTNSEPESQSPGNPTPTEVSEPATVIATMFGLIALTMRQVRRKQKRLA